MSAAIMTGSVGSKTAGFYYDPLSAAQPVCLPGSKSIAARALVLSYVFGSHTRLTGLPDCDDTRELAAAMELVAASGGSQVEYNLGTGGTSLRFFLALAASLPGKDSVLDCSDALRRRPLNPLISSLRQAGADIECLGAEGCAPMRVRGKRLSGHGVTVDSGISSQFASALLMVSPLWSSPFLLPDVRGAVSRPYIDMTLRMARAFGRKPEGYCIEADWSAASYFYEYALLNPGREVIIDNMPPLKDSLQGDSVCADIFGRAGVRTEIDGQGRGHICGDREIISRLRQTGDLLRFGLADSPDLVPALAVGLCCAGIRFSITDVAHLRHKESDRLSVLAEELGKAGYEIECGQDRMSWNGIKKEVMSDAEFDSHGDHRMAMSFVTAAPALGEIRMRDADVVTKSFPDFYSQVGRVGVIRRIR